MTIPVIDFSGVGGIELTDAKTRSSLGEASPERMGGRGLPSNSHRPIYHLPFLLIFGVSSEGKNITQAGPRLKTYPL